MKADPVLRYTKRLQSRVAKNKDGINLLSRDEQLYWAVNSFIEEANFSFCEYFSSKSSNHIQLALNGLDVLRAKKTKELLSEAIKLVFQDAPFPPDHRIRRKLVKKWDSDERWDAGHPDLLRMFRLGSRYCTLIDRENVEKRILKFAEERELLTLSPFDKLYRSLDARVWGGEWKSLSKNERLFYLVSALQLYVHDDCFRSFFVQRIGDYHRELFEGLEKMGATTSKEIVEKVTVLLFNQSKVPAPERRHFLLDERYHWIFDGEAAKPEWVKQIEALEKKFRKEPDNLSERIEKFAIEKGLISAKKLKQRLAR